MHSFSLLDRLFVCSFARLLARHHISDFTFSICTVKIQTIKVSIALAMLTMVACKLRMHAYTLYIIHMYLICEMNNLRQSLLHLFSDVKGKNEHWTRTRMAYLKNVLCTSFWRLWLWMVHGMIKRHTHSNHLNHCQ